MTTHEERQIRQLVEMGDEPETAQLRVRDGDLWIGEPDIRPAIADGPDAVRQWEEAHNLAYELANLLVNRWDANPALTQLACDARDRSAEALRRARERAGAS